MGLDAAFSLLEARLQRLAETLTDLYTTVAEDRPLRAPAAPEDTPALVDILGGAAENMLGYTMEALAAARDSRTAALHGDMDGMRRALAACHERGGAAAQHLFAELLTYERIADLARVGRTRGGEWRAWASGVKQALDGCRQPLFDLQQAQLECWLEAAERSSRQTFSVQTLGGAPAAKPEPVARGIRSVE
jgi:hypothetical protein